VSSDVYAGGKIGWCSQVDVYGLQVREQLSRGEEYATALRQNWESFDPQLIGEALFATANIFSILKLIHF